MYLCLLYAITSNAQVINVVGCRAPYETQSIGIYKDELIHCGFDTICGVIVKGIGRWNSTNWKDMGNPVASGGIKAYAVHNGDLYAAGVFWYIGGKQTNKIAKWNGAQWDSVGSGIHGSVEYLNALASYKGKLYAGGVFNEIGGNTNVKCIASWNGTSWERVKDGIGGNLPEVNCMAVYKDELYVGGRFQLAGTTNAYYIARWDGVRWRAVGKGTNYVVHSMVVDTVRDVLFIGGSFDTVDDTIPGQVAMWDGNKWHQIGDPQMFKTVGTANALEMYHGYLYAGGNGNRFDGTDTMFARWDGMEWENIPGFYGGSIGSLKTYNDELYIGGNFSKIGNDTIPNLARYYSPDTVTVGIKQERKSKNTLTVYPNPGGYQITIIPIAIGTDLKFESFSIKDIRGKEKLTIKNPPNNSVDISSLERGMYILSATTKEKEIYNTTFIKE